VGAAIAPGAYQTIALHGAIDFQTTYGLPPTYEIAPSVGGLAAVPDMLAAVPGGIGSSAGLTDVGEPVVLFYWNGASDLVRDVDYVFYGNIAGSNPPVDKTNVAVDGPDNGTATTRYLADTPLSAQRPVGAHQLGGSIERCDLSEGGEHPGGNGITGQDETSEPMASTWRVNLSAPGMRTPGGPPAPGTCP
jgi:hypothetical protein